MRNDPEEYLNVKKGWKETEETRRGKRSKELLSENAVIDAEIKNIFCVVKCYREAK